MICVILVGMNFLIGWDPKYIKLILHLRWTNHLQGVLVLDVTSIRVKVITKDKLSIDCASERRLKVKLGI